MSNGSVYVQTNDSGNRVVAFRRADDGVLTEVGTYDTGGAGDGEPDPTFTNLGGGGCDSPTSLSNLSITHTYAAPGAYEAVLATATFPCGPNNGGPPAIHGVGLHVCIVVGPGEAGAAGCPTAEPIYILPPAGG